MPRRQAIDLAIDAAARPGTDSLLSVGPLPDGVKCLLRIVADGEWRDPSTEHVYKRHKAEEVRAASATFLAAVLFDRASDPYRVLGLAPKARSEDVRENKRLLLKWLHPDRNPNPRERAYLARVLEAAEAIESGHAEVDGRERGSTQPRVSVPPRAKPVARPRQADARHLMARAVQSLLRGAKVSGLAAGILLAGLIAWRYGMNEPIGVSIARYSQETLGFTTW